MQARTKTKLLLAARELIAKGKERYLCYALSDAGGSTYENCVAFNQIREFIGTLLEGQSTLEKWLRVKHPECLPLHVAGYNIASQKKFRKLRLAWIDWMLTQPEITGEKA